MATVHISLGTLIFVVCVRSSQAVKDAGTNGYGFTTDTLKDSERESSERMAECVKNLTSFVESRGLCSSLEDTSESVLNSCANRCDQPKDNGNFLQCACDDKCLAYKDCCEDMDRECPETYQRGRNTYGRFGVNLVCKEWALIGHREQQTIQPKSASLQESTTDGGFGHFKERIENLKLLFGDLHSFLVADTVLGLLFNSYAASASWGIPDRRLAFVPQVTNLACLQFHRASPIVGILSSCVLVSMADMPTVLHRACGFKPVVSCPCWESDVIQGNLRHECPHQNQSVFSDYILLENHSGDSECTYTSNSEPHDRTPSEIVVVDELAVFKPMTGTIGRDQSLIKAKLTPLFMHDKGDELRIVDKENTNTIGPGMQVVDNNSMAVQIMPMEFLLELDNSLERKLRCESYWDPLLSCHLEECANDAIMLKNSILPWAFRGRTCMVPVSVTVEYPEAQVEVSVCTCVQIASAFTSLRLWDVSIRDTRQSGCMLKVKAFPYEKPPAELYTFPEIHAKPTDPPFLGNLSKREVRTRLEQQMWTTRQTCIDDTAEKARICFYVDDVFLQDKPVLGACLDIDPYYSAAARGGAHSNSASPLKPRQSAVCGRNPQAVHPAVRGRVNRNLPRRRH
ncbi:hypothetical protein EGW08_008467 [Elysia chlorotica]|uniref:SMB domain-containing protein n=1 Tax=Elysia chlorotica TaxID=188477 RepID=A0A433TQF5_ELYCH|nr:hypothetical protein EGW08_008467 [Elysia chlorotica]